jgi:hypothetical protein
MAYKNGVVSAGTTAVLVATPSSAPDVDGILIQNLGSVTVYLGGSTVTANTASTGGYQLAASARACSCPRRAPPRRGCTPSRRALPPTSRICTQAKPTSRARRHLTPPGAGSGPGPSVFHQRSTLGPVAHDK